MTETSGKNISGFRREDADKIADLAEPFLQRRQFTHIYVECGRFDKHSPTLHFSSLPDGQDIFDLASLTKALVTVPLVYQAAIDWGLTFSNPIRQWLGDQPTLLSPQLLDLSIADLLSHRSGLPAWRNFWIHQLSQNGYCLNRHEHIERVLNRTSASLGLAGSFVYSDLGYILLGYMLEKRYGNDLREIFSQFKQRTLNFSEFPYCLDYRLATNLHRRTVPTSFCAIRNRPLQGEVHDENCAALGGISGHAGLFGSGEAIVEYLRALMASAAGKNILAENATRIIPGGDPLLGWRQRSKIPLPRLIMGHMGFTGTSFWLDSSGQSYGILLTNRVISGRSAPWMTNFRSSCMDIMEIGLTD